jgi:hypothetical protein
MLRTGCTSSSSNLPFNLVIVSIVAVVARFVEYPPSFYLNDI